MINSGLRTLSNAEREAYQNRVQSQYQSAVTNTNSGSLKKKYHSKQQEQARQNAMRHLPSPLGISSGKGSALNIEDIIEEAAEDREMDSLRSPEIKFNN